MKRLVALLVAVTMLAPWEGAVAQAAAYPTKPVRIVVPFVTGGYVDGYVRLLALHLGQVLGQPVIIENKPGNSGQLGSEHVAKAAPDGYTLLGTSFNTHAVSVSLYANLPFDPVRDFTPISLVAAATTAMVVHPSINVTSVGELIALARSQPGTLSYGSAGVGTLPHILIESIKSRTGIKLEHIPYKGENEAMLAVMRGDVAVAQVTVATVLPHIKSGRVRVIATGGATRSNLLPDVPTIAETLPGISGNSWVGLFGPAHLPPEIVLRLNREIARIMRMPELQQHYAANDITFTPMTPEEFGAFQRAEIDKWAAVIRANHIHID